MTDKRPTVLIVQRLLPHYRVPFFRQLHERLHHDGIKLQLVYGTATEERGHAAAATWPWATQVPVRSWRLGAHSVYVQNAWSHALAADLVVVEHAGALLLNYPLWLLQQIGRVRMVFWGHGRNFQATAQGRWQDRVKNLMARRVHGWVAYTELSVSCIKAYGVPPTRITNVQNAIDTTALRATRSALRHEDLERLRARLGIRSERVGVYIGRMYPEKRMPFLVSACHEVRKHVPDFEMVFIGEGEDDVCVRESARAQAWMHHVEPQYGLARVPYVMLGQVLMMPGLVGLAVLDAFALETPMITVSDPRHGPEIHYLRHGENGLCLAATTPAAYARSVAAVLTQPDYLKHLKDGCVASAQHYTLENMVERFSAAMRRALE
ncbi:MAG: glycosyltransferase family 4 protein [Bacteroidota bacterium]